MVRGAAQSLSRRTLFFSRYVIVGSIPDFLQLLAAVDGTATAFNPYAGSSRGNLARLSNLSLYLGRMLERRPRLLLLGEAPGYRGCRVTGVPFTSEAILLADDSPFGLFGAAAGFAVAESQRWRHEASATAVWQTLVELASLPLLWNAFPYHPHQPARPDSNRPPTTRELDQGRVLVFDLLELFSIERVIAVGNKPAAALDRWGIAAPKVRHPGHGGRTAFRRELGNLLASGV
jgi:hypothetical protein